MRWVVEGDSARWGGGKEAKPGELATLWRNSSAMTSTRPSTSRNDLPAPIQAPTPSPETRARASCTRIACVGVLYLGSTFASAVGNDPPLATLDHMRIPTFAGARRAAIAGLKNSSSSI